MQYNYLGGGVGERAGAALGFSDAESATSRSPRLLDLAGLARGFAGGQRVDMLLARRHFAPHGILAVEDAGLVEEVEANSEERCDGNEFYRQGRSWAAPKHYKKKT